MNRPGIAGINWRGSNPGPVFTKRKVQQMYDDEMPTALWCEFGGYENGHAFSSKDPNYRVLKQSQLVDVPTGNWSDTYGQATYQKREEVTEVVVLCGEHASQMSKSFRPPEIAPPALSDLEREDTNWRAGYDAAMEKILNRPMTDEEKERLGNIQDNLPGEDYASQ
jgi:hypothetical protein